MSTFVQDTSNTIKGQMIALRHRLIAQMHRAGFTVEDMARREGVHEKSIRKWLHAAGIRELPHSKPRREKHREWRERRNAGVVGANCSIGRAYETGYPQRGEDPERLGGMRIFLPKKAPWRIDSGSRMHCGGHVKPGASGSNNEAMKFTTEWRVVLWTEKKLKESKGSTFEGTARTVLSALGISIPDWLQPL